CLELLHARMCQLRAGEERLQLCVTERNVERSDAAEHARLRDRASQDPAEIRSKVDGLRVCRDVAARLPTTAVHKVGVRILWSDRERGILPRRMRNHELVAGLGVLRHQLTDARCV